MSHLSSIADTRTEHAALAHDGSVLLDAVLERTELATPPSVAVETAKGFSPHLIAAIRNRRGEEPIGLAKTRLGR